MSKKVMVIDDSLSIRKVVGLALKGAGYEVLEGADGAQALDQLRLSPVNLIICDVNMPNMDGISFLKNLRAEESLKFTPVIMLTTESQEALKAEGMAAGARAWIVKPFQPEQLLSAVSKLIV